MITRPVFIVGMPRSGSTALHRVLAHHPDFASTTRVTRKCPTVYPALRLLAALSRDHTAGEAGSMWDRFLRGDTDVMEAEDLTPRARAYYTRAVENVLRLYRRDRFLAKCPRLGLRMGFLGTLFPDAQFVHLVRDGRAVCHSVLEQRVKDATLHTWWDARPEGWQAWAALPPHLAVAHQWDAVVRAVCRSGERVPPGGYLEVRYEDFTADPPGCIRRILEFCGLAWSEADLAAAVRGIESRNGKWRQRFAAGEVEAMMEIMGATMARFGYA